MTWTWLSQGNLKSKTESLLIATQNNAIKTNYVQANVDNTQQNTKCGLCRDRRNWYNSNTRVDMTG